MQKEVSGKSLSIRMSAQCLMVFLILSFLLSGCASRGGRTYSDGDIRTPHRVEYGTLLNITSVMVEEDPSGLGTIVGGVAGGVLGSLVGGGSARVLGVVGGALVGGAAGSAVEFGLKKYKATELTVEMDSGEVLVIVQGVDDVYIKGDKVRVITTGEGKARVQHQ